MAVKLSHVSAAALMAVALAACGGGSDSSANSSDASDVADAATTAVEETTAAATNAAEDAAAAVEDTANDAADAASDAANEVQEAAQDAVDAATDAASNSVEIVNDKVTQEIVAQYTSLTGDATKGKRVFTQCLSCHVVQEGVNRVGPSLYGIVGREAGSVDGFKYSDANANSGIVWTEAALFAYLENPRAFVPGTIMAFPGLKKPQDRADIIAYLKSESN